MDHYFDMNGDVIGINTAILGRNGSIGIGFSIPANECKACNRSIN